MASQDGEPTRGQNAQAISHAVVRLVREYTGRGPTMAHTTINDNMIVVVLRDTLLKAELNLVRDGQEHAVMDMRRRFQSTMREDLVAAVTEHSGRTVEAFLSDNAVDAERWRLSGNRSTLSRQRRSRVGSQNDEVGDHARSCATAAFEEGRRRPAFPNGGFSVCAAGSGGIRRRSRPHGDRPEGGHAARRQNGGALARSARGAGAARHHQDVSQGHRRARDRRHRAARRSPPAA
jgi:uncharacterized protein YbcI